MKMTSWQKKSWTTSASDQINLTMRGMATIGKTTTIELLWPLINRSDGFQHVDKVLPLVQI
jgi:hypothetical protein